MLSSADAASDDEKLGLIRMARKGKPNVLVGWKLDLSQWMGGQGIIVGVKIDASRDKGQKSLVRYRIAVSETKIFVADLLTRSKLRNMRPADLLEFCPAEVEAHRFGRARRRAAAKRRAYAADRPATAPARVRDPTGGSRRSARAAATNIAFKTS